MESWGALGCYLSHVKCWDWLLGRGAFAETAPRVPNQDPQEVNEVFILEDDACFESNFAEEWAKHVVPLLKPRHREWDVLVLGYFAVLGDTPASLHGTSVRTLAPEGGYFGGHGYILTRHGATILRQHAFPVEVQVDHHMAILQQLGLLRLYLVGAHHPCAPPGRRDAVESMVKQCMSGLERGIDHGFQPVSSLNRVQVMDLSRRMSLLCMGVLYVLLIVLLALVGYALYRQALRCK